MFPIFLENTNLEGYKLYNIDDKSTPEEIEKGKRICKQNNIPFIPNTDRGLQWAWHTIVNEVSENIKFVIWCTHDMHPLTPDFFKKLDALSKSGKLDEFGVIGFNTFGPQCNVQDIDSIKPNTCGILGKAPLSHLPGRWFKCTEMSLPWDVWGKPFAVDSPTDMCWMINVKLFKQIIQPSNEFHLFCAPEDVSMQFLYNNIYNIVLPEFVVWHNQQYKSKVNIPVHSAGHAKTGDETYFGHWGKFYESWKDRWGFERDDHGNKEHEFEQVKGHYKGTLIYDLFYHDYTTGPIQRFDI